MKGFFIRTFANRSRAAQPAVSSGSILSRQMSEKEPAATKNLGRTLSTSSNYMLSQTPTRGNYLAATVTRGVGGTPQFAGNIHSKQSGSSDAGQEAVTTDFHPKPAPPVSPPNPPPPAAPSECHVEMGPIYVPGGSIPVDNSGGEKSAMFQMFAEFATGMDDSPRRLPSCCEVRQYIRWDDKFHQYSGGPPHEGFPASATPNTWYEDRDQNDTRYGHRSGPHSDPAKDCEDEYRSGGFRNQTSGNSYCGKDTVSGPSAMTGKYEFQLKAIDTCNGNAEKASSSVITVDWGTPL